MLLNAIIERLKEGTIKNIVAYSDSDKMPEVPYVVVKPENGAVKDTRQYRIIVHHTQGKLDVLEAYAMTEIDELLCGHIDYEGHRYLLFCGGYTDVTPEPQDNTYFMERIFFTPLNVAR